MTISQRWQGWWQFTTQWSGYKQFEDGSLLKQPWVYLLVCQWSGEIGPKYPMILTESRKNAWSMKCFSLANLLQGSTGISNVWWVCSSLRIKYQNSSYPELHQIPQPYGKNRHVCLAVNWQLEHKNKCPGKTTCLLEILVVFPVPRICRKDSFCYRTQ